MESLLARIGVYYDPPLHEQVECLSAYAEKVAKNADIILVSAQAEVVGLAAAYANDDQDNTSFLTTIGILPEYRGGGFGDGLLERIIAVAKARGMRRMRLHVQASNVVAQHLYKQRGFKVMDVPVQRDSVGWLAMESVL